MHKTTFEHKFAVGESIYVVQSEGPSEHHMGHDITYDPAWVRITHVDYNNNKVQYRYNTKWGYTYVHETQAFATLKECQSACDLEQRTHNSKHEKSKENKL